MDAMTAPLLAVPAVWTPPTGVRVRGTLALLVGAAESAEVYARFGARIASDGYVVGVFGSDDAERAVGWLAGEVAPRVLVGSDRGAAVALSAVAAAAPTAVDGVIVAGLPVAGVDDAVAEDSARTACPVHLGVLGASARTAAAAAPVAVPDPAALAGIDVPVLALHGGADPIAPLSLAVAALAEIPRLEFVETVDGLHDALNDQSHRSVAATVVLWLERVRAAGTGSPIVRPVTR